MHIFFSLSITKTDGEVCCSKWSCVYVSLKVFFVMFFGTYAVGQASPNLQTFASARGAAYKVYSIIDQVISLTSCPCNFVLLKTHLRLKPMMRCS